MIFGIDTGQFIALAQFLGMALLGAFWVLGTRRGAKRADAGETYEVAGALVDSRAVDRLTAAIEAHTMALTSAHLDHEKARQLGHKLVDEIGALAGEVEELRRAAHDIATQIARKI